MSSDIDLRLGLGRAVRSTLQTLQENRNLTERTHNRLTTGKKINSVVDGVIDYFRSEALIERSNIFSRRRDEVDQAISNLEAHITALDSLEEFIDQLKGHVTAARSKTNAEDKASFTDAFREVGQQILLLVNDVDYNGLNLLASDNSILTVRFSDVEESRIDIVGQQVLGSRVSAGGLFSEGIYDITAAAFLGSNFDLGSSDFTGFSNIDNSNISQSDVLYEKLRLAETRIENITRNLGNRVSLLKGREEFLSQYTSELLIGSEKISVADLEEESANSKALELKHQIALTSITNANRNQEFLLQIITNS
ncbi:MAG: hypothetical protein K0U45_04310 [Alphaproteobacteria bacterium]|nr:hypothetical protein [Alphaproteobacteria bacterium]